MKDAEKTRDEGNAAGGADTTERSAEEVAWDKEFQEPKRNDILNSLGELVALAVKIPATILAMPLQVIPEETKVHGRAAIHESFLAARSLLDAIGDSVETMLANPESGAITPGGPEGTWGTRRPQSGARNAQPDRGTTPGGGSGKARRIELMDDIEAPSFPQEEAGGTGLPQPPAHMPHIDEQAQEAISTQQEEEDQATGEGRGMRANIEY